MKEEKVLRRIRLCDYREVVRCLKLLEKRVQELERKVEKLEKIVRSIPARYRDQF